MTRPIQYYGGCVVTPIAPSRDAFTERDVVMVTRHDNTTRTYRGDGAYVAACHYADANR